MLYLDAGFSLEIKERAYIIGGYATVFKAKKMRQRERSNIQTIIIPTIYYSKIIFITYLYNRL